MFINGDSFDVHEYEFVNMIWLHLPLSMIYKPWYKTTLNIAFQFLGILIFGIVNYTDTSSRSFAYFAGTFFFGLALYAREKTDRKYFMIN